MQYFCATKKFTHPGYDSLISSHISARDNVDNAAKIVVKGTPNYVLNTI